MISPATRTVAVTTFACSMLVVLMLRDIRAGDYGHASIDFACAYGWAILCYAQINPRKFMESIKEYSGSDGVGPA